MSNVLFICSRNKKRSPTGEHVGRLLGFETMSAGLAPDADELVCSEYLNWAEIIFVMESKHKTKLNKEYSRYLRNKKIIVLNIPDNFEYMQPELIELFEQKLRNFR